MTLRHCIHYPIRDRQNAWSEEISSPRLQGSKVVDHIPTAPDLRSFLTNPTKLEDTESFLQSFQALAPQHGVELFHLLQLFQSTTTSALFTLKIARSPQELQPRDLHPLGYHRTPPLQGLGLPGAPPPGVSHAFSTHGDGSLHHPPSLEPLEPGVVARVEEPVEELVELQRVHLAPAAESGLEPLVVMVGFGLELVVAGQ